MTLPNTKRFVTPQDRMTVKDVSEILGISVNTIQRRPWRAKTRCPLKKIGRCLVTFRPQFNEWLVDYNGESYRCQKEAETRQA